MNPGIAKVITWLQANTDLDVLEIDYYTGVTISVLAICDENDEITGQINVYNMGEGRYTIDTCLDIKILGLWCPEVHQLALDKLNATMAKVYDEFKEGFIVK